MKILLTSAGISNQSIHKALLELLGKPIAESNALFVPTAIYGIIGGAGLAQKVICGTIGDPFCQLGWKSLGLLELTALPTIKKEVWVKQVESTDALLVGGGDCQYLCYWMKQSGLAELLPSLLNKLVYVGLSAGSMVMASYGTTRSNHNLPADTGKSLNMFGFAIHPHLDHEWFPENSFVNLQQLAKSLPIPSYLIDDQTAIQVINDEITVISEGKWAYEAGLPI